MAGVVLLGASGCSVGAPSHGEGPDAGGDDTWHDPEEVDTLDGGQGAHPDHLETA